MNGLDVIGQGSGITAAKGYKASAVRAGIKKEGLDLAVFSSDVKASAAAVFTRNLVQAAPIGVCRKNLKASRGCARAVVVNSGNANACTGEDGRLVALQTAKETARLLGVPWEQVLVASTGVIGQPLPMDRLIGALPQAVADLSVDRGGEAAAAILTTDTCTKESVVRMDSPLGPFTVGGMAKGSGMIHPDMATTLVFITTDAEVEPAALKGYLGESVDVSFNRITVDGDTSTNDMAAILANGMSGVRIEPGSAAERGFQEALTGVLSELARAVVRDGEGATKLVTVEVTGAKGETEALKVAKTIATSQLVKTAVYGADANWGRIVGAAGRAGVDLDPSKLRVSIGGVAVLSPGYVAEFSEEEVTERLRKDEVVLSVDLGQGAGSARVWTCDLTHGYIDINASYRT